MFIENPAVLKLLLKMFKRKKHCSPSHRWKRIQKINRLRVWKWKTRHWAAKPCNSGPVSSSTVTQTVVKDRLLIRLLQNNTQDLTAAIPFYISKDWMPFQIVQRSGFVKVMKVAMPHYKVPSQTLFFKTEIPTCTSRLKLLLHKIKLQFKVHALQQVRGWSTTTSNFSLSVTSEQAGSWNQPWKHCFLYIRWVLFLWVFFSMLEKYLSCITTENAKICLRLSRSL